MSEQPVQRIRARWVLPLAGDPVENGVVEIAGQQIRQLGPAVAGEPVQDLGDLVLMPGLVNVHTHLEFSHLEQPISAGSFPDWIRSVIDYRQTDLSAPGQAAAAIAAGIQESLSHGVTTIGEIATRGKGSEVYASLPSTSVVFREVIGLASEDEQDHLHSVTQFLADSLQNDWQQAISPHAPYTLRDSLLDQLLDLSLAQQLPAAMHLAESEDELQLLRDKSGALRALLEDVGAWRDDAHRLQSAGDYLQRLSRLQRVLVIHGNYLEPEDWQLLASQRDNMALVYCPRTHRHFDHPDYQLADRLAAGVRVAIGTDSRASSPDLDLLAELKEVHRQYPQLSAETVLQLGTVEGASALGLEGTVGQLLAGSQANMVAVAVENPHSGDLPAAVLAESSQLVAVMCDGRWVRELL